MVSRVPYPGLTSWAFSRAEVPRVPLEEKRARYLRQSPAARVVESLLSRFLARTRLDRGRGRWLLLRGVAGFFRWWFRVFNRLRVRGRAKLPDRAIFYANHPGSFDVLLLLLAVKHPVSCFFSFGDGWFADFLHERLGFVSKCRHGRDALIELSIRRLLTFNRYFAIWPEGSLSASGEAIKRGYSSVARVYAVVNSHRNVVPFVPVLFRGSSCYAYHFTPTTTPVAVDFLDPFYLPRAWLRDPARDPLGKTPREIVDYLMHRLARAKGQRALALNKGLERRRARYRERARSGA